MTTHSLQSERHFEENVETFYRHMGYDTRTNTTLHTRPAHIHAHLDHPNPKDKQKVLVECKHYTEPIGIEEVQRFCSKIAFARENGETNLGVFVSYSGFTEEAALWCKRNCSFVRLRTYKQVMHRSARVNKLVKKFQHHTSPI